MGPTDQKLPTWGTSKKMHVSCWSQMDQIRIWNLDSYSQRMCIFNEVFQVILMHDKVSERVCWGMVREVEHG